MKKLFSKLCFSVMTILLCANIFTIASANTSAANNNAEFVKYDNQQYNFQINYPIKWQVKEGVMGTVVAFLSPVDKDDNFSENTNVVVQDLAAYNDLTLDKYEELGVVSLRKVITDFELLKQGDTTISGAPAKMVVFTGRQGVLNLKYMQVYTIINHVAYVITFTAEEAQYNNYEEIVQEIIGSLVVK